MEIKNYKLPPIVWLRVTDFMHGWLQHEFGGAVRIQEQRVVSIQHLPGVREVLRMETRDDTELGPMKVSNAMSSNRKNMLAAGMLIDAAYIASVYDMTPELMRQFIPVECPRMCLTRNGVLRPWTLDVSLCHQQAGDLMRIIRTAFWQAVEDFNALYARRLGTTKYPSIDMVEAFCQETDTPDIHADDIKREWNRRVARGDNRK